CTGAVIQGDQFKVCVAVAPLVSVAVMPVRPAGTVVRAPLLSNLNGNGPLFERGRLGALEVTVASHWLGVASLVKVAVMTWELPNESYMLTGTAKVAPVAAEASRLRLALNEVVAFAARFVPTGTIISPIGLDVLTVLVLVSSDQPCTRWPVAVVRIPFGSTWKLPARVNSSRVTSALVWIPDPGAAWRTIKNPSPWIPASFTPPVTWRLPCEKFLKISGLDTPEPIWCDEVAVTSATTSSNESELAL